MWNNKKNNSILLAVSTRKTPSCWLCLVWNNKKQGDYIHRLTGEVDSPGHQVFCQSYPGVVAGLRRLGYYNVPSACQATLLQTRLVSVTICWNMSMHPPPPPTPSQTHQDNLKQIYGDRFYGTIAKNVPQHSHTHTHTHTHCLCNVPQAQKELHGGGTHAYKLYAFFWS